MSEWVELKLTDVGSLQRGKSKHRPRYAFHLYNGKYPFIQTGEVRESRKYISEFKNTYSEAGLAQSKLWPKNTLCITIAANIAELGILKFDACFPDSVIGFIPDKNKSNLDFVYYTLCHFQRELKHLGEGSVQDNINLGTFNDIKFMFPSLAEQKAIASVLSSLDNKIDLLHRQNKTLEAMAETLFRQWFVEDSNDSYKEVELHEIIEFNPKRVLPKGSKAMYLEMAGLNTNTFAASGYYERNFSSGQKFIKQDTLLARITPCLENGKAGYVHFLSPEQVGWGSTEFIILRPKPKFHPLFSYILCRNNEFKEYAESCMEGSSGRQRVNVSHLSMYTLTLPNDDVITQFNEILVSIEPKLISNALQIQTLENLRDTLLPKLMSGEVRVNYTPEEIKQ